MNDDCAKPAQLTGRSGLSLAFILIFLISPLKWASPLQQQGRPGGLAQPIPFTPHVTPLGLTVTPQVTAPIPLQHQASPVPEPPKVVETPVPPLPISGGDTTVGYDFIEGSNTPTWRVWFEGEVIFIRPDDPAAVALLNAFQDEATERATATANSASAANTLTVTLITGGFGALSAVGGTIVAVPSCAGVPLTFWAGGGTGWPCAGGVLAAVGGVGAFIMSGVVGLQAFGEKVEADEVFEGADREANDLFEALKGYASP